MTALSADDWRRLADKTVNDAERIRKLADRHYAKADHPAYRDNRALTDYHFELGTKLQYAVELSLEYAARWAEYADDIDRHDAEIDAVDAHDAGYVSAETAVITAITCGSVLFLTACALIGLG